MKLLAVKAKINLLINAQAACVEVLEELKRIESRLERPFSLAAFVMIIAELRTGCSSRRSA
jgi:hypothetical protein